MKPIDRPVGQEAPKRRRAKSPHSVGQLNKAISHIYDAAVDSTLWPSALAEILRFVGNSGTHLWLMDRETSQVTHSVHVGMPDNMIAEYNGEVIKSCPRWENARRHPDRTFLFDYQHIEERDIDSNEYYHWLQSKGDSIRYYLGGRIQLGNNLEGFQSLAFRKQEGHSQKKHLERLSWVLPHVQRAMQIGQRLGTWQFVAQSALEILNKLSYGVVILDESGKQMMANLGAERLLGAPCRVSLREGRLRAVDAEVDQQLGLLIGRCAATSSGKGQFSGGSVRIPVDGNATPVLLHVYPLKLPQDSFTIRRSAVVVFMVRQSAGCEIDTAVLKTTFGLTAAERRLASVVLGGASIKAASRRLDISPNTARTQLKGLFAKVGVHRQADLVRVLLPFVLERH